jgi:hypothetical protein
MSVLIIFILMNLVSVSIVMIQIVLNAQDLIKMIVINVI